MNDEDIWESLEIPPDALPQSVRSKSQSSYNSQPPDVETVEIVEQDEQPEEIKEVSQELQVVSEVEKRLQKANLYQQWISGELYDSKTQSTIEVEQEFKEFALRQLNKLIGINVEQENTTSQFTNEEAIILKALVQKILSNKKLKQDVVAQNIQPKKQKEIKKETINTTPPKLKTKALPTELQKKPVQETSEKQNSGSYLLSGLPPAPKPLVQATSIQPKRFYKDEEEFTEGSRKFKAKWIQINTNSYGKFEQQKLEKMPQKSIISIKGLTIYKTEGDELYSIIKQDITPREVPINAVPFPSIGQMEQVTLMKAVSTNAASKEGFVRGLGAK